MTTFLNLFVPGLEVKDHRHKDKDRFHFYAMVPES